MICKVRDWASEVDSTSSCKLNYTYVGRWIILVLQKYENLFFSFTIYLCVFYIITLHLFRIVWDSILKLNNLIKMTCQLVNKRNM